VQVSVIGNISFLKAVKKSRIFEIQVSVGRIIANVFLDSEGVTHFDFLPRGATINANLLHSVVHKQIRKERPGKISKFFLLHDNTRP
jgi:hypothetical protein